MTWVGLAAIGVAAFGYIVDHRLSGNGAVVCPWSAPPWSSPAGRRCPGWGPRTLLRLRPFQWFGRLSYSLYLWHWPILILAAEAVGRQGLPFHRAFGWLLVSLAAAWVTFRLVENPVRHARALTRSPGRTIGMGIALVSCSLAVATVALTVADAGPASRRVGTRRVPGPVPRAGPTPGPRRAGDHHAPG